MEAVPVQVKVEELMEAVPVPVSSEDSRPVQEPPDERDGEKKEAGWHDPLSAKHNQTGLQELLAREKRSSNNGENPGGDGEDRQEEAE